MSEVFRKPVSRMASEPQQFLASATATPARTRSTSGGTKRSRAGSKRQRRKKVLQVRLHAVIVSVIAGEPVFCVETEDPSGRSRLPVAEFKAERHRSLEQPLIDAHLSHFGGRPSVPELLDCQLGQVEPDADVTWIEITYLSLVQQAVTERRPTRPEAEAFESGRLRWQSFYMALPWEDWRHGRPSLLDAVVLPLLATSEGGVRRRRSPNRRRQDPRSVRLSAASALFSGSVEDWDPRRTLERYEALVAAGAIVEAVIGGRNEPVAAADPRLGTVMASGDRRRVSLALSRLRRAVKDRPDVSAVMPAEFTLFELQRCVEGILGPPLHKQNFRRQLEAYRLLEPVGRVKADTGGRPAQLYRFIT